MGGEEEIGRMIVGFSREREGQTWRLLIGINFP